MSNSLVNLRIDFAFKQLFGTNGNEDILVAFLNAILKDSLESPIVSLQLEDPHLHREYEEDKLSILDISTTLNTGTKVNVEIQLNNNHDMIKRSLYYWGRLYTSQLQKGMPYSSLHKTITINLLNFAMFPEYEAFHTTGILWNQQQQKLLSDDIEVHIVEIPKLLQQWREEKVNPWEDSFVRWLLLLPANEDEYLTQTLEDIAMNQDPILQKAINKWEHMSQDSSFRQAYEAREKALMDEAAKFAHARNEGKKEGIQQGKIQMIKGMHELGVPLETIAKASKLDIHEVERILKQK
ncbi:Rpn family recombination-promoting nuclease/putative transposase [Bacillus toyonensis]|uniref:Rpn family recombination-promoting nuclease/putative transposase n=1 Tax=Bacillus toyonensis TaxID=155322 RepID=UPI0008722BE9|nr:Rpn family recombination-promoting nuclease/putative transposase [Bacillus toyonensis]OFC93039.1 PD-(D/E)XK nuclease family transposase [Bacillus thuringiensis]MCU5726599.1 Rpn family recombination-promoting nuclease/putative transposase [Bacillus toyonensis]MDD9265264.1 Rpn family recombination-promoting nuclease/putative transposase [Bacillus toyonensis]HDR3908520.1 PD-(D/E)XK nuclease family transposase [Bacillus toyonensis]HDR7325973.1 PD-(D/E)XK nuclease family transposase [Bacillus to